MAGSGADQRSDKLALVALGVQGGPPPSAKHYGISTALVVNGRTYIVDCGRGSLSQYMRAGIDLASLTGIFLTHLHIDHVIDYISYLQLAGGLPVRHAWQNPVFSYGPGSPGGLKTYPDESPGTVEMTNQLNAAYGSSENFFLAEGTVSADRLNSLEPHDIELPNTVSVSADYTLPEIEPFHVMSDDNITVTATLVPHGAVFPALGFRVDTEHGSITFSGDTAPSQNLIRLAKGSDVLVHEAMILSWFVEAGVPPEVLARHKKAHTDIAEVGRIAKEAEAKRVVISHIGPGVVSRAEWQERLADSCRRAGYQGSYSVAEDGKDILTAD